MNPDQTVQEIRELRATLFAEGEPYDPYTVRRLAEKIDELDSWLTGGNPMPAAWKTPWDEKRGEILDLLRGLANGGRARPLEDSYHYLKKFRERATGVLQRIDT